MKSKKAPGERTGGPPKPIKAVGLISGGLDSELAAKLLSEQGVEVVGLNFSTGFCKVDHRRAVRRKKDRDPKKLRNEALQAGADIGIPIEVIDVSQEYLDVVINPKHGYGRFANPCIDCRIFMLKKAKEYADEIGAEIVFTGEVLGQRPMSQHARALTMIEKETELKGRLLRPLSARLLPATDAEERGDVRRERLLGINGRGRHEQFRLAEEFGIQEFSQPGGGCCYLADENYARRFRDLVAHKRRPSITRDDLILLKVGRHYRLSPRAKAIVGRDEAENAFLQRFASGRWLLETVEGGSPMTLIEGEPDERDLDLAARITARYSDQKESECVAVRVERDEERSCPSVVPASDNEILPMRL